jgi:hypothetical protein
VRVKLGEGRQATSNIYPSSNTTIVTNYLTRDVGGSEELLYTWPQLVFTTPCNHHHPYHALTNTLTHSLTQGVGGSGGRTPGGGPQAAWLTGQTETPGWTGCPGQWTQLPPLVTVAADSAQVVDCC